MRKFLEMFCSDNAETRRQVLLETLSGIVPERLSVETTVWPDGSMVHDTVNYAVTFGRQSGQILFGAHYDAVPRSPGANDNGAAVTQLVFAVKDLQAAIRNGQPEPDCTFVFFDHEELFGSPFMGSRTWIERHRSGLPKAAIIYDVTGRGNPYISGHDETGLLAGLRCRSTPGSDDINFSHEGIPATLVCALPEAEFAAGFPYSWKLLHTPSDTTESIDDGALEAGKKLALATIAGIFNRQNA